MKPVESEAEKNPAYLPEVVTETCGFFHVFVSKLTWLITTGCA